MSDNLDDVLDSINQKNHVLRPEAIEAKKDYDAYKNDLESPLEDPSFMRTRLIIQEFNQSIDLLNKIFEKSRFDELAFMMSQPSRMIFLNLVIGIVRGLGIAIGIILVALMMIMALQSYFPTLALIFPTL